LVYCEGHNRATESRSFASLTMTDCMVVELVPFN
jgi:hypothetical protein